MKVDKSLQEVWDWKDKVYQETKHLSMKETVDYIHKGAEQLCKKYGLKLKTLHSTHLSRASRSKKSRIL
jgi:uncharacterized protein YeaC (DUF1315 family)